MTKTRRKIAFDVLHLDGQDVRQRELVERRAGLSEIIKPVGGRWPCNGNTTMRCPGSVKERRNPLAARAQFR
jgi:ATP-dependent DNA ligase